MIRTILAPALIPLIAAPLVAGAQQAASPDAAGGDGTAPLALGPAPLALGYATFEAAVPHLDLDACPEAIEADGVFCRVTFSHDEIHVFAFAEDGDQPLVEVAHVSAEGLGAALQ